MPKKTGEEIFSDTYKFKNQIEGVLESFNFDYSNLTSKTNDPDSIQKLDEGRALLSHLENIYNTLKYFEMPVVEEGVLVKTPGGKYQINGDGFTFSSGSSVEVLYYDEREKSDVWVKTRVEHTSGDYYFYDLKEIPLAGARVRRRSEP